MSQANNPKIAIRVYERFPVRRTGTALHQITLDQVKKYASKRPLRRPPLRKP